MPATFLEWPLGQLVASELTVTFKSLKSIELLSVETPYVPGMCGFCTARMILMSRSQLIHPRHLCLFTFM